MRHAATVAVVMFAVLAPAARAQAPAPSAPPGVLAVFVAPNPVLAGSDETVHVAVQVRTAAGDLVDGPAVPTTVMLSTSNPKVLRPYGTDGHLALAWGRNKGRTGRFVSPAAGVVTITAAAPGFAPVEVEVRAVPRGDRAAALRLFALPPAIRPGEEPLFIAQFLDPEGRPAFAPHTLSLVVDATPTAGAATRRESAFHNAFTSSQVTGAVSPLPGVTTYRASAAGLISPPVTVTTVVSAAPPTTAADRPAYTAPPAASPTMPDVGAIEAQAERLGADAATSARDDVPNAESIVADHYRRALALSADAAARAWLTEAFRRGYRSILG